MTAASKERRFSFSMRAASSSGDGTFIHGAAKTITSSTSGM
jgi:hypothetical protein